MFRNILVCVDRSPQADEALTQAIDLADCQRSRLTILTAIARPPAWLGTPMTVVAVEPLSEELRAEACETLRRATESVPDCIPVTTILSEEPVRDAIAAELERGRYDLLVIGTRGRGPLGASLRGSVSAYAMRRCQVPVLMVRADEAKEVAPECASPDASVAPASAEPLREVRPTTI